MVSPEKQEFIKDLRTDQTLRALWFNGDVTARKAYLKGRFNFSLEDLNQLESYDNQVSTFEAMDDQISIAQATTFWGRRFRKDSAWRPWRKRRGSSPI